MLSQAENSWNTLACEGKHLGQCPKTELQMSECILCELDKSLIMAMLQWAFVVIVIPQGESVGQLFLD